MKRENKAKIAVLTLGCSKNVVDSEVLLGHLSKGKVTIAAEADQADVLVINTCGFIDAAKQESIDAILEAVEQKKNGSLKKVVVMGCLSERFKEDLKKEIPDVDAYFGTNQLAQVITELGVDYKKELLGERSLSTPRHYAYLKISEGCDHPCSFCAIPLMRGKHLTKPIEEVIREAESLASKGVRELIVIGQDTTSYGIDLYGKSRISELIKSLSKVRGIDWIRLMYAYPAHFPEELISMMRNSRTICRYLDLPIQHIADPVLRSMRRGITKRATEELLTRLRNEIPDLALRTTLILGYPEEGEKEFEELREFVTEFKFDRLGVFTYSHEEGTSAYALEDRIPGEIKEERKNTIMKIQQEISETRNQRLIGKDLRVLVDRREGEYAIARSEWDAPDIDQEIYISDPDSSLPPGTMTQVHITDATEYDLMAEHVGLTVHRTSPTPSVRS
ncbi:MAG: 30S ribosomal protein S12 methylthiotransferase RimO [bacterium]